MKIQHPTIDMIKRGSHLYHLKTAQWVSLCNCAGVADYRKIGWAKSHPSEYSTVKPEAEQQDA
jgi:hypothetical protein